MLIEIAVYQNRVSWGEFFYFMNKISLVSLLHQSLKTYIYKLNEKGSQLQTAHKSMFNTNILPFGLLQCMVDWTILGKARSVTRS